VTSEMAHVSAPGFVGLQARSHKPSYDEYLTRRLRSIIIICYWLVAGIVDARRGTE
jgi:hypothetical protein